MSEKNRFNKPVAFNKKNEEDNKILAFTKRRNFSGTVKKAMLEYIERHQKKPELQEVKTVVPIQKEQPKEIKKPQPVKPKAADRIARLKEELKKPSVKPGLAMFNQKQ